MTPSYWAPGQTYNVTITTSESSFINGNGFLYILNAADYQNQSYWNEDPYVTVSNLALVNANEITFTVAVAAGAPIETGDGWSLVCFGNYLVSNPGSVQITPCAISVVPTITSVAPAAFFAGETTALTITGTGFIPSDNSDGCTPTNVDVYTADEDVITGVDIVSPTEITATVAPDADETSLAATVGTVNFDYATGAYDLSATAPASVLPVPAIQWTNPSTGTTSDISVASGKPTDQSAVVGEPINLTIDPTTMPSGIASPAYTWTVGGTNIGGYPPIPSTPSPITTGAVTPTTTSNQNLSTYWVYPSTSRSPFQVTYSYCFDDPIAGQECSPNVTAAFNVSGPTGGTMTFTPSSSTVTIANLSECITSNGTYPGGPYLVYAKGASGTACGVNFETPGITYNTPTKYQNSSDGTFSLVQLISSDVINGTTYGPGLDTGYPDAGPPGNDNPWVYLPPTAATVNRDFTANLFLMWTPNIANSIPVPLGYQTWGFNGSATCTQSCGTYTNWKATTTGTPGPMPAKNGFVTSSPSQTQVGNNILVNGYPTWNTVTN